MTVNFKVPQPADLQGLTVAALIDQRADQMPFRLALSAYSVVGYRDRLGYAQLALYMRRVGAGLAALGVAPGDRVAVYLDNNAGREAVLTALGCMAIGAVVVPVNTRSADDELRHALALVRPSLLVTTAACAQRLRGLHEAPITLIDAANTDFPAWPEPTQVTAVCGPVQHADASLPACLLYTSGTTARSKAVIHTHRSMLHAGLAMGTSVGLGPGDLYQGAFPFFTSSCLNLGCMSAWVHGAGFVMEHALDNQGRLRLIESECTTVYHGVPSVLQLMLGESQNGDYDLRGVHRIAYGGAAMPVPVIERIAEQWPWMSQVQVWGMTESGPAGCWLPPYWLPAKAGLIGQPMAYCELRVADDSGQTVATGETGELLFRGASMAQGYFEDEAATAQSFRAGWLHTGDMVVQDDDGLLRFVDRKKDVINRGGFKVSSAAVEAVLYRMPGVAQAAVVAVAHDKLGEDVAACIVVTAGMALDAASMAAWCDGRLADYEIPRRWAFMDDLPKNPMGKVLKRELRSTLADSA